ncbi:MAG: YgfZ/GcvT domain-containing protein [Endozoicomonas sp.]
MNTERKQILVDFLQSQGARFEQDRLTAFSQQPAPARHAPALAVLESQTVMEIRGPDTGRFLQGQLTSNVDTLAPGHCQSSAVCTPKGRMYSSFNLLHTEQGYLLAMHEGLVETTASTLGKYAVFFKSGISTDINLVCLGLSGDNIDDTIESIFGATPQDSNALKVDNGWLFKVPGLCSRYELWLPVEDLEKLWEQLTPVFTPAPEDHWRLLDLEAVQPRLRPEAMEKYIPQHLNLASLGSVSFRKGCYTGQEIVARMQNLGELKSRTYRLTSEQQQPVAPMTKLFNSAGKSIGEVLEAICPNGETGTEMLAVIRVEAAEAGDVYLDAESSEQLRVQPLPYEINPREELQR